MRFGISDRSNILNREEITWVEPTEKTGEDHEPVEIPETYEVAKVKEKTRKRYTKQ